MKRPKPKPKKHNTNLTQPHSFFTLNIMYNSNIVIVHWPMNHGAYCKSFCFDTFHKDELEISFCYYTSYMGV